MKLENILSFLEEIAPLEIQERYDNSGLILGSPEAEVNKVLVCLDVDQKALELAARQDCELILSHHPAIFQAVKDFTSGTKAGDLLVTAIKNNIALLSTHTNFDSAVGGLSDLLCRKIGVSDVRILQRAFSLDREYGFGRYGNIAAVSGKQFVKMIKTKLSLKVVRLIGNTPESISKVAVFNGSYDRDILPVLLNAGPDAFITGDLKYHDAQELLLNGIFTIDAGHYGTEKLFIDEMSSILENKFPNLTVLKYEGADVFSYDID